eukprot:1159766-Pelagomonas_calceolata.AAC.1
MENANLCPLKVSASCASPHLLTKAIFAVMSKAHDLEHPDGKVHTYDEHEDSVYGLCWSAVDPWLFATLSYDGRLVLNSVPKNVKYKILV